MTEETGPPKGDNKGENLSPLPPGFRGQTFAVVELLLDMVYAARAVAASDLESVLIYYCVSEATMRPLLLGDAPPEVMNMPLPPEQYRGSISRLLVADRVGLPRETVRRKIAALIASGLLVEDGEGRVRTTRNLAEPHVQKGVGDAHAAVMRYRARLKQFGVPEEGVV